MATFVCSSATYCHTTPRFTAPSLLTNMVEVTRNFIIYSDSLFVRLRISCMQSMMRMMRVVCKPMSDAISGLH